MGHAAPRTTKFLVEVIGDLETVNGICSRCPEGISLEENFGGWEPTSNPLIQVFLVAHQDLGADTAALLFALALEDLPARGGTSLWVLVTVGIDVELATIEDHFRRIAECNWVDIRYSTAPGPVIQVKTTNMTALLKGAAASSRQDQ
ncbi:MULTISPECIES: hypothetical protein [Achromobacter]|uniref:Uncharacterized protein n=1 Tax=Achromobacter spanius TaxID=217203 RepID=A0ABY8GUI4_9BURK|nr:MULTISPECIES: hypothetical protein [Achromobacter]WAI82553.1 hypothetical protein N8Z00_24030 [Achromobacter spanius]WEX92639.1 hypothetical protein N3Z32_18630 [Achromobacter sp. SS2-2022]WFP08208.1 hypothetical protein P8T11_28630 [Achromobacter spanius]